MKSNAEVRMLSKTCRILLVIIGIVLFAGHIPAQAAIPKQGTVAIVVGGVDEMHTLSAQAIFVRDLRASGYKVVDESTLNSMRRSEAGRLALEGNVNAILSLSSRYGISTFITAYIRADSPVVNEFKLYTGTASIAVQARAKADLIYGDTVSGKQVGYTPGEAAQKSIEAAAALAARNLAQ